MATDVERRSGEQAGPTRSRQRRDRWWIPFGFLGPLVVIFALFYLWPAFNTVVSSFFEWGLAIPGASTTPPPGSSSA
ncbi:MAG: hypothetical protein KY460_06190 [Actinobacteria bacterium]|nr:hypothetical protein [Actinomycetota bacterium]